MITVVTGKPPAAFLPPPLPLISLLPLPTTHSPRRPCWASTPPRRPSRPRDRLGVAGLLALADSPNLCWLPQRPTIRTVRRRRHRGDPGSPPHRRGLFQRRLFRQSPASYRRSAFAGRSLRSGEPAQRDSRRRPAGEAPSSSRPRVFWAPAASPSCPRRWWKSRRPAHQHHDPPSPARAPESFLPRAGISRARRFTVYVSDGDRSAPSTLRRAPSRRIFPPCWCRC